MPSMSAVGNRRPTLSTTMRSSYSTTVMFLPISPSPPRGRTRSFDAPTTRARAAEHVRAGVEADRVGGDAERVVDVLERRVDLGAALGLGDHAAHLVADD